MSTVFRALTLALAFGGAALAQHPRLDLRELSGPEACGVCHPRHYFEWRGSAHAYSAVNPLVEACNRKALLETNGKVGAFCVNCHVPLGSRAGELSPAFDIARETSAAARRGITCEVCHKMEPPPAGAPVANAAYELRPGSAVLGRLHNPSPTPAHESIQSELIGSSEFCGHCHDVQHNGALIEKTFAQWSASAHKQRNDRCQDCHMLRYSGQAAVDGPYRETLHRHNFPAISVALIPFPNKGYQLEQIREFLRTAARLAVIAPREALASAGLPLTVRVKNSGAGHNFPTGIANERQLWVEVIARDAGGKVLFESGGLDSNGDLMDHHSAVRPGGDPALAHFADRFLDAAGKEVPFIFHASDVEERSLKPLEERSVHYRIPLPAELAGSAVRVRVRLLFRSFPPYALRDLGLGHLAKELPIFELDVFEAESVQVVASLPRKARWLVPGDHATPGEALQAALDGDEIVIAPGEYLLTEPLDFGGRSLRMRGAGGPLRTTLRWAGAPDAERASLAIFAGNGGPGARLEGLTLTAGRGTRVGERRRGGGILVRGSSPTIANCRILDCAAGDGEGGGIAVEGGSPEIVEVEVRDCRAELGGGVAALGPGTRLRIFASSIHGNFAAAGGGLHAGAEVGGVVSRTLLAGNTASGEGGGLDIAAGSAVALDRLTLVFNRAGQGDGVLHWPDPGAALRGSVLWANEPAGASVRLEHCLLGDLAAGAVEPGSTNRGGFPLFRDPSGSWDPRTGVWLPGDYHLLPVSPAIDGGDPRALAEPDDSRADIGAFSFPQPLKAFVRGDVDGDGRVATRDIAALAARIQRGASIPCDDAADVDDSGEIDPLDLMLLVGHLLLGEASIAPPVGECGLDPTHGEGLGCDRKAEPCLGW